TQSGYCLDQQRGGERDGEADQKHPTQRRVTGKRRLRLRIADREPRKAGKKQASKPFGERPARRRGGQALHRTLARKARHEPPGGCEEERVIGTEESGGEEREHALHAAESRQGDVDPGSTRAEEARPEREADPRGSARCRGVPPK